MADPPRQTGTAPAAAAAAGTKAAHMEGNPALRMMGNSALPYDFDACLLLTTIQGFRAYEPGFLHETG